MSSIADLVPDRRWPLHPKPRKREVLNAWVPRIASAYGVHYDTFLRKALARTGSGARDMDALTEAQLALLASGTGVSIEHLRSMNSKAILDRVISNMLKNIYNK